ncbi:MAG: KH domain-containing protein [Chloroflexi bacterium]|nr:KH domain-containing protein [Chloroflexota bacterium]
MKELIEFIARSLVDDPTEVSVTLRETEHESRIELSVAEEDMGRVIGRQGRVANAMRTLMRVISSRQGVRSSLDIV